MPTTIASGAEFVNFEQAILLSAEAATMALLICVFVGMRLRLGLAPIAVLLGIFQAIQSAQATAVFVDLFPAIGFSASPGSVVFFNGSTFAMLLILMRCGSLAFGQLATGLMIGNVMLSGTLLIASWHLEAPGTVLLTPVSIEFVQGSAWILLVGTIALFVDLIVMRHLWQRMRGFIQRHPFVGIYIMMTFIQCLDALIFFSIGFFGHEQWWTMFLSGVFGKLIFATFFAVIIASYQRHDSWSLEQLFAEMNWPLSWFTGDSAGK